MVLISSVPKVNFIKRVKGINLKKCSETQKTDLKYLFKSSPVLVFEDQNLTPQDQFEICSWFDPKHKDDVLHPFYTTRIEDQPQISIRGKGRANMFGVNCEVGIGQEFKYNPLWHMDVVGSDTLPPVISSMYMLECPENGGSTMFANLEQGFINMSHEDKKSALNTNVIYSPIHSFNPHFDYTGYGRMDKYWENFLSDDDEQQKKVKDQFFKQPLLMYPDESATFPVVMLSPNKVYQLICNGKTYSPKHSQEIIRYIMNKYIIVQNNVGHVNYKKNDLLIFNNRKVIHSSTPTEEYSDNRLFTLLFLATEEKLIMYKK